MTEENRILLHVGAPKCGSSALQMALSAAPELATADGRVLSYKGLRLRGGGTGWKRLSGRWLRLAAARSVHGYVSWPNPPKDRPDAPYAALDRLWARAGRRVPVVSNEGWISQAERFAAVLPHWFEAGAPTRVEICAFARPPLDWLNAAYWQWGVWSGRSFEDWLGGMGMPYRLGAALSAWAALPNTRVRPSLARDVLGAFETAQGVTLPRPANRHAALPPAMAGFLMRNRRYRVDPHDNATEFVFQRWCRVAGAPRLWAIAPNHVQMLRQAVRADLEMLFALLPEEEAEAARADPRWTSEQPYHELLRRGRSRLNDPEEMAQLYRALVEGVRAAAETAGRPMPALAPVLATRASVHSWDVVVAHALEHLIALDTGLRRRRGFTLDPRGLFRARNKAQDRTAP